MKKLITTPKKVEKVVEVVTEEETSVVEAEGGLLELLGKDVYCGCMNYAYAGKVTGVNEKFIELSAPKVIYETGPWNATSWKDAQALPTPKVFIAIAAIENIFAVTR